MPMFFQDIFFMLSLPLAWATATEINVDEELKKYRNKTPYMEIEYKIDGKPQTSTLRFELFWDDAPRTTLNFVKILTAPENEPRYLNNIFHRIIPGFMMQGGDITRQNGTGGTSIYGNKFNDEPFINSHEAGVLSMANSGKDTNGSQFFITFKRQPHLDGYHVVFGRLKDDASLEALKKMENVSTDSMDFPNPPVKIVRCGIEEEEEADSGIEADEKEDAEIENKEEKAGEKEEKADEKEEDSFMGSDEGFDSEFSSDYDDNSSSELL